MLHLFHNFDSSENIEIKAKLLHKDQEVVYYLDINLHSEVEKEILTVNNQELLYRKRHELQYYKPDVGKVGMQVERTQAYVSIYYSHLIEPLVKFKAYSFNPVSIREESNAVDRFVCLYNYIISRISIPKS